MIADILHTLLGFSAIANLMLGVIVLSRKKNNQSARFFFLLTISLFLWSANILLLLKKELFIFDQLATIGGTFSMGLMGLFIASLAKLQKNENFLTRLFFIFFSLFFSIAVFVPEIFIAPGTISENQLIFKYEFQGPLQIAFFFFGLFSFLIYVVLLVRSYIYSKGLQRKQIVYIALAAVLSSLIGMVANLFLPTFGISVFGGIGPIGTLFFTGIVTYSILKNRFLKLEIFFAEVIIFVFLAYSGALVFLSDNLSDFGFKFLSFLFTFYLALVLLRSIYSESRLRENLENVYQNQSNFLADIAHRLKTPLTIAQTNLSVIKAVYKDKQVLKQSIQSSRLALDRLSRLSTNLIILGKIDFGLFELNKENLSLSDLVSNAADDFKLLAGNRKITSEIETDINFYGDPIRLREMILNLLDNAVKFTDSKRGVINVSLKRADQLIIFTITDNGQGIDSEHLPHLFIRYYQANSQSKSGSAGIGLAIVKWVVDGHNGAIKVESQKNQGARFVIEFKV